MKEPFVKRSTVFVDITQDGAPQPLSRSELAGFESFDALYRSLCAILYNYVPMSGHPGGSISSGRIVAALLFDAMDYDVSRPDRRDSDIISYAAGHKAMGLYAMWALRNEVTRVGAPELLPSNEAYQLRLEDLLGFRRNPTIDTPLFRQFRSKALDGHPTPATPFVKIATGASGVGVASSMGLGLGAIDAFGSGKAPKVHIIEGEGGLTPGRVAESVAFAGTASLGNVILHLDWNQASIDSEHVTREGEKRGDYVQWEPAEFFHINDWNVILVPDGKDFQQVVAAQRKALAIDNGQPTAIIYRTVKGWQYGIEGRASHGAGHKMCTPGFYDALEPMMTEADLKVPSCEPGMQRCAAGKDTATVESCFWQSLSVLREVLEANRGVVDTLSTRLRKAIERLDTQKRALRAPERSIDAVYEEAQGGKTPEDLMLAPGTSTTLRSELGRTIGHYNRMSKGSVFVAAADLLGSTSVNEGAKGFPAGFYNARTNSDSRTLAIGGICEDAISGVLSGLAAFGSHIGVASSYGAFIAPLGHIAMRLHAIGNQAREVIAHEPYKPMVLICAHAGLKTGEDGPTHADPQPLQLLQENFPPGTMITLTPWEPAEIFPLFSIALAKRPAVIVPFVTRPNEKVPDRSALGLAPASDATRGVYCLRKAKGKADGTIVLQESGVTYAFVEEALPRLLRDGIDLDVYYIASTELFDMLPQAERARIFPEASAQEAMGITGFTMATMYRWIRSDLGRSMSLHPYQHGHFLGSGQGAHVIAEAGLDGEGQYRSILKYVEALRAARGKSKPELAHA
jgi:transketolase